MPPTHQDTKIHQMNTVRNLFFPNGEFNNKNIYTFIESYSNAWLKDGFAAGVFVADSYLYWAHKIYLKIDLKNRIALVSLFLLLIILNANAQNNDTIISKAIYKNAFIPTAFIGIGVLISGSQFEQNLQTNLRNKVGNEFNFPIDDYVQFAPIAQMYLADLVGVKSKNHWFDQSKYLLISNIISSGITHGLKNIISKTRPNGEDHSFPSGHTTLAFTNATVLYNEFNQSSPILAYSGYAFAVTTGTFRMLNNKHWFSDVLVGAGIGILATEIVYYFEPLKNFNPFKKSENISFVPYASGDNYGFYFSYRF